MSSTISRSTMTDDTGAGTDGTILNNAWLQDIYDRIDAMFAGAGAYATFAFGGAASVVGNFTAGPGDHASMSGVSASDQYFFGANYTNGNGSDAVTTSGKGSWRMGMRVATTLEIGWDWRAAAAGASTFTRKLTLDSTGVLTAASSIVAGDNLTAGGTATISWSSRSLMTSPADGHVALTNNASSAGVRFKFTTDARLEVRNRADSDYADIYGKAGVFSGSVTSSSFVGTATGNAPLGVTHTFGSFPGSMTFTDGSLTSFI